jgi:cell division ATPase FtsA
MKAVCAVAVDKNKAFLGFSQSNGSPLRFLGETEVNLSTITLDLSNFLKENLETIHKKIQEKEAAAGLKIEKIFFSLPWGAENSAIIEEVIPLKQRKKIDFWDIQYVKKYVEDAFLGWDDYCLHHLVFYYEIDGNIYKQPPLGVLAKKIKVKSLLIWIKDKLRKEAVDIFSNFGFKFAGFIFDGISAFAAAYQYQEQDKAQAVFLISQENSRLCVCSRHITDFSICFDWGIEKIIRELEKQLGLSDNLAGDLFNFYASFRESSTAGTINKEITLRNQGAYVNISLTVMNKFLRDFVKDKILKAVEHLNNKIGRQNYYIVFLGGLNKKDGFNDFVKSILPDWLTMVEPVYPGMFISSGCLSYGLNRFLENDFQKHNLLDRISNIYKEYF